MNKLLKNRINRKLAPTLGCLAVCSGLAGAATAQNIPPPLPSIPGLTELQFNVAVAVQTLCPKLPAPNPNGTGTERLSQSCTQMVVSAAYNEGNGAGFPPQFNMDISDQQLATGLQAISPVQMNAQTPTSIEAPRMNLVGARLLELRSGTRGFVVGVNGHDASPAAGMAARSKRLEGATGGAAGDDALGGRWGGFVNIAYNWGDVDRTSVQDAYDYGSFTVLAGADYRFSDAFVLGGAVSYTDTHSDYDLSLGDVDAKTWSLLAYGTYYADRWYVDGYLAYGWVDYDSKRGIFIPSNNPAAPAISTTAVASPNGNQWSASIGVGYNYQTGTMTLTPSARLAYIRVENDAFDESEPINGLGLRVDQRSFESLQTLIGARLSGVASTSYGVLGPYVSAYWVHEFENDSTSIFARYVNDPTNQQFFIPTADPTRDYAVVTVGSTGTFANNLSGFVQFQAALGLKDQTNYGVVLGLRKQF